MPPSEKANGTNLKKFDEQTIRHLKATLGVDADLRSVRLDIRQIAELAIREAMNVRRKRNLKRSGGRAPDPKIRAAARRFANEQARKLKKEIRSTRDWAIPMPTLVRARTASPILDALDPSRPQKWKPIVSRRFRREYSRVELRTMNFLDDPIGTLSEFVKLSGIEQEEVYAWLDFKDDRCHDVGAYLVLAEVWPQLARVFRGGRMSTSVQKVLSAIEIDRQLGIGLLGVKDHQDVWAFPLKRRRPRGSTKDEAAQLKPQEKEKVSDQLCDLINEWLEIADKEANVGTEWELSDPGKALLSNMTGELLCNAERHSVPGSDDGDWSMTAFMAARENDDQKRELRCYFAFLSVGQSIAESMKGAPQSILLAGERYVGQFGSGGPSRDTLLTVLALQDTITSVPDAEREGRGGTGLQDVLELIGDLGASTSPNADVKATIVSGKSCIRLKHPYLVGTRDPRGKRVQWCNSGNDPTRPPDRDMAFDLPQHFAGTLISVGFTLDSKLFASEESTDDDE